MLTPAALAQLSMRPVTVAEPLLLGESAAADLRVLRLLREATSHAVRLRWTLALAGPPRFPLVTHVHLVPPEGGTDPAANRYAAQWGAGYRYGSFFYRQGPGFVLVKDVRPGAEASRMVIEEGAAGFVALAEGDSAAPHPAELLADAEDAGLMLRVGDAVLVLPYRMRHWPVPYAAV